MQELINTLREVGLNIDINHSLSRLSIRSSHTQSCLSIIQIVKICRLIQSNTALQEIDLSDHNLNIGYKGAKYIAKVLQHNTTLQEINLFGNDIGAAGTERIANALQHNTTLQKITLSLNDIGAAGAEHIAKVLQHNTTLQEIKLSCNDIGAAGEERIAKVLQHNTTLQKIDLSLNNIGAEGAERIANVLQHNTTLQKIDLSGNNIGDKGTEHISNALQHNTTLQEIKLSTNNIGDEGAEHIAKALQGNYSLINITLINQIASIRQNDLEGNIKQALERNKQLVVATARSIYEHFANDGSPELTEQLIATLKFLPLVNQSILQKELLNLKAASDTINYIEKAKNYALDHWLTVAGVCNDRTLQILQELMNKDEVLLYKFNDGKPCDIAKLYKHPAMSKIFSYMPIVPDEHDCDLLLSGVVDIWALPENS